MVRELVGGEGLSLLKEKQQAFIEALNDKLPRNIHARLIPSQKMSNVVNIVIGQGNQVLQLFGLSEDTDKETGEHSVYWFYNYTGGLY